MTISLPNGNWENLDRKFCRFPSLDVMKTLTEPDVDGYEMHPFMMDDEGVDSPLEGRE